MILVGQYDSPFVRRVAVALHVYGMPFERDRTSVFSPAMARINPLVRIPSLVLDDGEVLFDSGVLRSSTSQKRTRRYRPPAGFERRMT